MEGFAELKNKNADATEIEEKLTKGLEIASSILAINWHKFS